MTHYFSPHANGRAREHKWRMNAKRKTVQLSEANNAGRSHGVCGADILIKADDQKSSLIIDKGTAVGPSYPQ
jgi:hypothetical protein